MVLIADSALASKFSEMKWNEIDTRSFRSFSEKEIVNV